MTECPQFKGKNPRGKRIVIEHLSQPIKTLKGAKNVLGTNQKSHLWVSKRLVHNIQIMIEYVGLRREIRMFHRESVLVSKLKTRVEVIRCWVTVL